mmetsp:Transcript_35257/g.77022  ORF Transcript_35257/g.77022 Transcript_35257/m.77022 type:complete len:212 (+) Transcript_35257:393-1028(+)
MHVVPCLTQPKFAGVVDAAEHTASFQRRQPPPSIWWQNLSLHEHAVAVRAFLAGTIFVVQRARAVVASMCPDSLILRAVGKVVGAEAAAEAAEPPTLVPVKVGVGLLPLTMPPALLPLPYVLKPFGTRVFCSAVLQAELPLALVAAAIWPDVLACPVKLVLEELAYVLGASVGVVQHALATSLVELEVALVVGVGVLYRLVTEAELFPAHV